MKKVRFGIIGCGGIGSNHARQFLAAKPRSYCISAVADEVESAAVALAEKLAVPYFTSGYELIDSGLVDAVLIATPHYFHPPLAIYAARAGIHVLTEKPLAVTVGAARAMVAQCRKAGVAFGVMFQQRNRPEYRKMKRMIESGAIGEVFRAQMICSAWYRTQFYYDGGAWRGTWDGEGGGVLINQGPHSLDLFQWMAGMPKRVIATVGTRVHDLEVENTANAILEYDGGGTGYIYATTAEAPGMNQLTICGDKGTLVAQRGRLRFAKLATPISKHIPAAKIRMGSPEVEWKDVPLAKSGGKHIEVTRAFANHILRGSPMTAEGAEGVNGLELSNAIYLSGFKHKAVELPVDAAEMERLISKLVRTRSAGRGGDLRKKGAAQLKKLLGKPPW